TRILLVLSEIGMDVSFARSLLQMAIPAWELIGPMTDKTVFYEPEALSELQEIEQGLLRQAENTYATHFWPSLKAPQEFFNTVQQSMHPKNLFSLLDDVSTPWIILPRAYRSLERNHCRYFPLYLDMICQSKNEQSLDKWIRIVIEFMANYSIKFANSTCPGKKIRAFVANGYEAMFWRNLKSPPAGFEDIRVFEHFYNWMAYSGSGLEVLGTVVPSAINRMKVGMRTVFPSENGFRSSIDNRQEVSCFQISLRHGCLGIITTGNYFRIGPLLNSRRGDEKLGYIPTLVALRSLFRRIERDFPFESKRTRYYIHDFLSQFETAYENIRQSIKNLDHLSRDSLQLLTKQILSMIRKLNQAL
ncbi:MAG: hypothetical protein QNK29_08395, partial [Desulfobacterales bacterium]|nr:hypothetical protein [Desulfobacterales bacterium]MDX2511957.1 hypothetical protein [Desulfobacterales bacterium]